MATELQKKVISNIAPVTTDECVYMSSGKTLKEEMETIKQGIGSGSNSNPESSLCWSGLKWVAFGDSITDETLTAANRKYCHIIAEKTGITMLNYGVGGTGYKRRESEGTCFYQRMSSIPSDADIITILGSVNDWILLNSHAADYDGFVQGNVTDTIDNNSLCGYINKAIDVAIETAPNAKIGLISPNKCVLSDKFAGMIRETLPLVAEYRGLPYLDLWAVDQLRPKDAAFAERYYYDYNNSSIIHPNNAGHAWITPPILAFMKQIIG